MKSPFEIFAAIVAAFAISICLALGATGMLMASWTDALASDKPSACFTIQDHLKIVDSAGKSQKTAVKAFVWTHPDDSNFKAFYVFAKNSPGVFGISVYRHGCSAPLPDGTAFAMLPVNPTVLKNLANAQLVFDTGDVGVPEADDFTGETY
jgi:hypothetical protein